MGIVQRQGLRNTVISYFGLGLGFVNTALLMPRFLAADQVGLTRVLLSLATIYAQLAAFGFASAGIRFFPYFRNRETGHQGFLPLLLGLPMLGFAVISLAYWLGRPLILRAYDADAALLGPYYGWCALLALFTLLYSLQDAYLKGLYHTAFSSFLQEVFLRVLIAGVTLAFGLGYLTFHQFVLAYIGVNSALTMLLTGYLAYIGELHLRPTRAALQVRPVRELLSFGAFALLSNISGTVISSIDALMVGSKVNLKAAGVYTTAFFISTALTIPFRSLYKIAFPLLADYWKEQDMARMAAFYRSTTRLNTVLGCYLALGIGLNLDFIYSLMKPEYAAGTTIVWVLLAGRLLDGITGVNGLIVVTSPRYRFDLVFNVALAAGTVGLNLLLIPPLGMVGAAWAALLALTSINVARTWFVWHAYRLQPFDGRIPLILGVAAATALAGWLVPPVHSPFVTMVLRSAALTLVYAAGLLLTRAVPEAQAALQKIRQRLH
ncbi:polysaccharide biosynthesis C-terminal domain-containing protein [Hymenobacter sp. 15J16-1T3B]|uniref:lipopolysaccharide biosynthesis protein n=1 Tax=Hymenobacter sp. 15J16-1T3B TaxID=2886941 RepID=UPI001D116984|nr:polysaccharide biosynthesis C-terminal domain-containing protein [Hymenobacter sp. 15J16-1T3B]MCC3159397.1 polysaccharide biosynthesis C-terminal domain-containing protein [Hymenobacter sp. 15J16-1T3B]